MTALAVFAGISLSVLVTSFISGILGMAGGMILMGLLLALMPVPAAMVLHGVTQMASNGWRAWLWRGSIDWRVLRGSAYGALAALALFAVLQLAASRTVVYLILGLTPFVSYALPKSLALNVDRRGQSFLCGLVCTALQLLSGIAGPLLDVFFLKSAMDRKAVVSTKAASQTIAHAIKIFYFGALLAVDTGSIEWWFALVMAGLAIAGTTLSRTVLERMSDTDVRRWTRGVVTAIGTVYLGRALWLLAGA
jgi:uncharacterized membrane protein YfcA